MPYGAETEQSDMSKKIQTIVALLADATIAYGCTYKGLNGEGKEEEFTKHATISDGADWLANGGDAQLFADALANLNPEHWTVDSSTGHIFGHAAAFRVVGSKGGRVFPRELSGIARERRPGDASGEATGAPVIVFKVADPKGLLLPRVRGELSVGFKTQKGYTVAASMIEPANTRARGVSVILCVQAELALQGTEKGERMQAKLEKRQAKLEGAQASGEETTDTVSMVTLDDGTIRVKPLAESGAAVSGIQFRDFSGEGFEQKAATYAAQLRGILASA